MLKDFLTAMVLPTVGATMVVVAGVVHLQLPDPHATRAMRMDASRLARRLRTLRMQPLPDAAEFSDVLPRSLSLGEVLARLEVSARLAKVDTISVEAGSAVEDGGDAPSAAANGEADEYGVIADRVHCRVQISASFAALTRFLGLVETGRPLMRIARLEIEPEVGGVRASLELTAFYDSGSRQSKGEAEEKQG